MKIKSKKAMTWQQMVLAIIAVVVVTFVIIWFKGGGEKAFGNLGDKIGSLGDCDGDHVSDMFDKCPCDTFATESKDFSGCEDKTTKEQVKTADKVGSKNCNCVKKEETKEDKNN